MNSSIPVLNPSRLALARQRRGISKTKLAELVGVQVRSISAFEKGEFLPSEETLSGLAKHLGFPKKFFFEADLEIPVSDAVSFRSMARMKASERDSALGASAIAILLNDWIECRFELPNPELPELPEDNPECASETIRSDWGLGYRPIRNMVHLLESKGVRVFSLAEDTRHIDAFSFWQGETPFIFLNTKKSAERSRFDAAHELGHLLMHKHGGPAGREAETQANAFASALLMPASNVCSVVRRFPTIDQLVQLKKKWTVSVVALLYRLWKLKIVTDWQYRSMCIDMAPYRKNEPEPAKRETSQVLRKVFDALKADGISKADVAHSLSIHRSQLEELIFGLTIANSPNNIRPSTKSEGRPKLRIVDS